MALLELNKEFESKYASAEPNMFDAINSMCEDAQRIRSEHGGLLSASESLNAAITGELPDDLGKRIPVDTAHCKYVSQYVETALCDIDDLDVRTSVKETMDKSIPLRRLSFQYEAGMSEGTRSRVRVICRLIWDNFYPHRKEMEPHDKQEIQSRRG